MTCPYNESSINIKKDAYFYGFHFYVPNSPCNMCASAISLSCTCPHVHMCILGLSYFNWGPPRSTHKAVAVDV